MFETKIVNIKNSNYEIYIGRENKTYGLKASKWANPFVIGPDGSRDEVLKKYEEWIKNNPTLLKDLHELEGKILGCWCYPEKCHGDILKKLLKTNKYLIF